MNMPKNTHQDPMMREHRRRFRIDGAGATKKMAQALKALEECDEAVVLALSRNGVGSPERVLIEVRCALRLLVEGPAGELRGRLG